MVGRVVEAAGAFPVAEGAAKAEVAHQSEPEAPLPLPVPIGGPLPPPPRPPEKPPRPLPRTTRIGWGKMKISVHLFKKSMSRKTN